MKEVVLGACLFLRMVCGDCGGWRGGDRSLEIRWFERSSAFQRGSVVLSVFIVLREDWTKEMEGSITRITRQKGKVVLVASGGTLAHIPYTDSGQHI